jgi:hypothetical protein
MQAKTLDVLKHGSEAVDIPSGYGPQTGKRDGDDQ